MRAYLVPPGSLAGRLATAATAEGGQRKQRRRRRWLGGLLRSPYWRGPFLSPCGPHCRRVGRPPVLSRSVREDAAHRQRRHSRLLMPPLALRVASSSCAVTAVGDVQPPIATAGFLHPLRRHHHLRLPQRPLLSLPASAPAYRSGGRSYLSSEFFERTHTAVSHAFFFDISCLGDDRMIMLPIQCCPIAYITELSISLHPWHVAFFNEDRYIFTWRYGFLRLVGFH